MRDNAKRKKFASALKLEIEKKGFTTMTAVAQALGCTLYAINMWLNEGSDLPGGRHGPSVLKLFGLDSREYGGDWKRGFGGNYTTPREAMMDEPGGTVTFPYPDTDSSFPALCDCGRAVTHGWVPDSKGILGPGMVHVEDGLPAGSMCTPTPARG